MITFRNCIVTNERGGSMPNRDGTGRLGRGRNCDARARADRAGRDGRAGQGRGRMGRRGRRR